MIRRLIESARQVHVTQDWYIYLRIFGQGPQNRIANSQIVYHQGVDSHLHSALGVLEDLWDLVGDVDRI